MTDMAPYIQHSQTPPLYLGNHFQGNRNLGRTYCLRETYRNGWKKGCGDQAVYSLVRWLTVTANTVALQVEEGEETSTFADLFSIIFNCTPAEES